MTTYTKTSLPVGPNTDGTSDVTTQGSVGARVTAATLDADHKLPARGRDQDATGGALEQVDVLADALDFYKADAEWLLGSGNLAINGGCRVAQHAVVTLGAASDTIAERVFGKVDMLAGYTTITASAGTLTQATAAPVGTTGFALHFSGVTLAAGGKLHALYRMEAAEGALLKGGKLSVRVMVYHDVGSAKTLTLYLRDADVADVFSATSAIANDGGTSVATATATELLWEGVDLSAANPERGLELEIELDCGAITTKNFYVTELGIVAGLKAPPVHLERALALEIALSQRFTQKTYNLDVAAGTASDPGRFVFTDPVAGGYFPLSFGASMRAAPTVTLYSNVTGASGNLRDLTSGADFACSTGDPGTEGFFCSLGAHGAADEAISGHYFASANL